MAFNRGGRTYWNVCIGWGRDEGELPPRTMLQCARTSSVAVRWLIDGMDFLVRPRTVCV